MLIGNQWLRESRFINDYLSLSQWSLCATWSTEGRGRSLYPWTRIDLPGDLGENLTEFRLLSILLGKSTRRYRKVFSIQPTKYVVFSPIFIWVIELRLGQRSQRRCSEYQYWQRRYSSSSKYEREWCLLLTVDNRLMTNHWINRNVFRCHVSAHALMLYLSLFFCFVGRVSVLFFWEKIPLHLTSTYRSTRICPSLLFLSILHLQEEVLIHSVCQPFSSSFFSSDIE